PGGPACRAHRRLLMPIRVANIRLGIDEPEAALPGRLARILGLAPDAPLRWRILRKALDARAALQFVYNAEVTLPEDEALVLERARSSVRPPIRVDHFAEEPFVMPPPGPTPLGERPVVIGSGPGGLVAAYFLTLCGYR